MSLSGDIFQLPPLFKLLRACLASQNDKPKARRGSFHETRPRIMTVVAIHETLVTRIQKTNGFRVPLSVGKAIEYPSYAPLALESLTSLSRSATQQNFLDPPCD